MDEVRLSCVLLRLSWEVLTHLPLLSVIMFLKLLNYMFFKKNIFLYKNIFKHIKIFLFANDLSRFAYGL